MQVFFVLFCLDSLILCYFETKIGAFEAKIGAFEAKKPKNKANTGNL